VLNFTIIKLCFAVIGGILLGSYFQFSPEHLWKVGLGLLLIFVFSYFRAKKLFLQDLFFGITVLLSFVYIGILTVTLDLPQNRPLHYINHIPEESGSSDILIAKVAEKLKPGLFQEKYIVDALDWNGKPVKGKILLNLDREEENSVLEVGEKLALPAALQPVNSPLNPHQFNYRDYMESLGVLRQINVSQSRVQILGTTSGNVTALAGDIRSRIISKLKALDLGKDELAIIQALLLGQRQEISQEIYSTYAAAGVIHILAVSGLHVGIILLLLNTLLKPLERVWKGKIFKTVILLMLLWGFAILAGLSPSVVRAVSMFSFVAVGMQLKRKTSVLNTLFASMLVLLLINPSYLTQVGFQLSYAAVFSIVLIQPHLFGIYKGESKLIKYFWGIITVTFAAQIGVLPLSLFYFHQFPGLFFLSNLVILPFLGILLGLGILVMILALLDMLPAFLGEMLGTMIETLNRFVAWTASKEDFLFQNITFSLLLCITSYFIVLGFIFLLKNFSFRAILLLLLAVIGFQGALIYERSSTDNVQALVFHKSRNTVIGTKTGTELTLYHDLEAPASSYSFLRDYSIHHNLDLVKEDPLRNIYRISGKTVLQIDSSGIYNVAGFNPNILILTGSPNINLERLLEQYTPGIIIADGSNYPSVVKRWKATARHKKIAFHSTAEKGAYDFSTLD